MNNKPYHDRATWRKFWSDTRAHWSMMKRYGRYDGRYQFFGEWVRVFTFTVYGKSGKELRRFTKRHVGKFDRYEVAERWEQIKMTLNPGQNATITLNGRVTRRFSASCYAAEKIAL